MQNLSTAKNKNKIKKSTHARRGEFKFMEKNRVRELEIKPMASNINEAFNLLKKVQKTEKALFHIL